jgi:hypothetical protein
VEDPKLGLIAKCAGQRRGDVIAMWHYLMEKASGADDRGNPGVLHFRSLDFLLELEAGGAARIYAEFIAEGLVDGNTGRLVAWDRRQPKKEDDGAAERKRQQRAREAAEREATERESANRDTTAGGVTSRDTGQSHGASRNDTLEESREEKNSSLRSEKAPRKRSAPPDGPACPADVDAQVWSDWLQLRKSKKAPVTDTVLKAAKAEAVDAGMSLESFLRIWCARGSQGLQADWLKPHELRSAARSPPLNRQEALEESNRAAAAAFAGTGNHA